MNKESLIKQLQEKEALKEKTESVFLQLVGQIALLRDLIKSEDEIVTKPIEEQK